MISYHNENSLPPPSSPLSFHPLPLWLLLPLISLPLDSPLPLPPCVVASCSSCVVCIVVSPSPFTFHAPTSCLAPSNRGSIILWPERSENRNLNLNLLVFYWLMEILPGSLHSCWGRWNSHGELSGQLVQQQVNLQNVHQKILLDYWNRVSKVNLLAHPSPLEKWAGLLLFLLLLLLLPYLEKKKWSLVKPIFAITFSYKLQVVSPLPSLYQNATSSLCLDGTWHPIIDYYFTHLRFEYPLPRVTPGLFKCCLQMRHPSQNSRIEHSTWNAVCGNLQEKFGHKLPISGAW